jgi:hypothetical protein
MSLYDLENSSNLYGIDMSKIVNPIQYLLAQAQVQNNPQINKEFVKDTSSTSSELNNVVKSKYNLFRQNEPQVVGSGMQQSKKRFVFKR